MTRFVPALVAMFVIAAASLAHADMGTLPNGVVLGYKRLFTHSGNSPTRVQPNLNTEDEWHYFNYAHCQCALDKGRDDADFHESTYSYEVVPSSAGTGPVHRPLQFWVGASCDGDPATRTANCRHLEYADIADIATIQSQHTLTPEVSLFDLMTPMAQSQCPEQVLTATQWLLTDTKADGNIDYSLSASITTDTLAPPLPTVFNATGAENAIDIQWTAPDGSNGDPTDIAYYQALCAGPDQQPAVLSQYRPAPHYQTPQSLCASGFRLLITQSDVGTTSTPLLTDAGVDAAIDAAIDAGTVDASTQNTSIPTGFAEYDPSFLCGEALSSTATELRIDHLQNDTPYQVMLVSIDKYGNPRGTVFRTTLTPKPVTDFWEDLHGQGSGVQGGFCLIAETFGDDSWPTTTLRAFRDDTLAHTAFGRWLTDVYYGTIAKLGPVVKGSLVLRVLAGVALAPLIALALIWHYLTLVGLLVVLALPLAYRHRRRVLRSRLLASVAVVAAILIVPHGARADGFQPYWQHSDPGEATVAADEGDLVHWQAGLRIGPYTPQIDAQLGKPVYSEMFGNSASILPMIDFDRVIWHSDGIGTIAVGGTIGYMSKTAHAFADMSTPGDPNRPRSSGDTTSFSLIPFALTVAYRATQIDDDYGIPIVPFARLGLAYYIWWVRAPSGDFAQVCTSGTEPDCPQDTGRGASLGVTGELGISVRAERIDLDAARSMREGGLLHASFFAEFQLAKVDGFGSSKKLSVGDNTWFAGVNFEF